MKTVRKKCYIYTRVSTAVQVDGFSLDAQKERLYEHADYRDLEIAGEYCDAGKSGKSIKGRPSFQQMMEDVIRQKDGISFVLVFKLSRFGRNAADVLKSMQTLNDFGVDLVSVDDSIDSSTQGGRLTLAILSAVAEIERDNIRDQFMAGRIQKLREGKWVGGPIPYGYRMIGEKMTTDPYEAGMVRKIFDLYVEDDLMMTGIVRYLNDHGYRRKKDEGAGQRPFQYRFVASILRNPVYCGKLIYGRRTNRKGADGRCPKPDPAKVMEAEGIHEKIVTADVWERAQAKRRKHSGRNRKTGDSERISLLSGIVKCPVCGCGMTYLKNKKANKNHGGLYKTIFAYSCPNHRKSRGRVCSFHHTYNQEKLDSAVFEIVRGVSGTPEFKAAVMAFCKSQIPAEDLEERLQEKRRMLRKAELNNRKLGGELDELNVLDEDYDEKFGRIQAEMEKGYDRMDELEDQIRAVREELDRVKKGVQASENIVRMLEHFQELYEHMTCRERREMYRHFIERIEVLPKTREDGKVLKSISFRFAAAYDGDGLTPEEENGEICFTLDCTKTGLTRAEAKATYPEIRAYVMEHFGLKVSSLYIAQIKRKYGISMSTAYNYNKKGKPKNPVPVCTREKEEAIVAALKHFRMLEPSVELIENREEMKNEG